MNRTEILLTCLMEECSEVAQRASKALRFGLEEVQAGQDRNNAERIVEELRDLVAVAFLLEEWLELPALFGEGSVDHFIAKRKKLDQWMEYGEARKAGRE